MRNEDRRGISQGTQVGSWLIVTLLFLSVCINYIDRGSLSVAAPVLRDEFSLTPKRLGYLLSAFFWSYTACQLGVGWLVDRYPVKWVYAGGFFLWSLAMALTGAVNGFAALFGMRLLLGVGESVFLPAASRIMVQLFPAAKRGLPNAIVDVGTKAGPAMSLMVGAFLITHFGWRWLFTGIGLASLVWLVPWIYVNSRQGASANNTPLASKAGDTTAVGILQMLQKKEVWGTSIGMFALGYVWVFLITWLPEYLVKERHFTMRQMGLFGSLPYWGMAAASLAGGWLSDRWIASGKSETFVRKTFALSGLLTCAALLIPAAMVSSPVLGMGLLIGACVALGFFTSNVWAITQTLAGVKAAGQWTGIQNFVGNLGGVASPIVAGMIVEKTGAFVLVFAVAAGIVAAGAVVYGITVQRVEEVR